MAGWQLDLDIALSPRSCDCAGFSVAGPQVRSRTFFALFRLRGKKMPLLNYMIYSTEGIFNGRSRRVTVSNGNPVFFNEADQQYYNGGRINFGTRSSTLVSSSPYLNHAGLRNMVAQEMLRRNGPDVPTTGFLPETFALFNELEDWPRIFQMFEEEKARLPEFKAWLDGRKVCLFKPEELADAKPGTLRAVIHDFVVNSGYQMDHIFQGMEATSDLEFYFKERAHTHDIEHMITGFETNHSGEIALLAANTRAIAKYFKPEFAAFIVRQTVFLQAKTMMRGALYYHDVFIEDLKAHDLGAAQGMTWKHPLFLVPYHDLLDWQVQDIREEYGITNAPPSGHWAWTTDAAMDPRSDNDDQNTAVAAE
jgi:hypothetical protein